MTQNHNDFERAVVSPQARVPSPENTMEAANDVSMSKSIEVLLTQALEQQCTITRFHILIADERLLAEQKHLTAIADDRHESILKVVSSTLTTNVGKLLEQTVRLSIEKSVLPTVTTTVKKAVEQQLAKTLSAPLEKTLPKEIRLAVNDSVHKALVGEDGGLKFSETISKAVVSKLEHSVQKDISGRLGAVIEKSLAPLVAKAEERMQSSIDKTMQRIQKENRASHQEIFKKLDALATAVNSFSDQLKPQEAKFPSTDKHAQNTVSPLNRRKAQMEEKFATGAYPAALELVCTSSISLT
jgi:hypothetical protein